MSAKRRFESGDLVLSERVLLRVPDVAARTLQQLECRYMQKAGFFAPALGIEWEGVDEEVLEAALNLFFIHPQMADPNSVLVEDSMSAAEDALGWQASLQGRLDAHRLILFLHVVDLNIHKDEES